HSSVRGLPELGSPGPLFRRERTLMPRPNRVTPFGALIATPERGMLMGNRGILHDQDGILRRRWRGKRWILCVLEFQGRRREIMTPGRYTELFFLDEATGLAAGHRPCAECQRKRFNAFRAAWAKANRLAQTSSALMADRIDDRLHGERIRPNRSQSSWKEDLDDLPDGVFVTVDGRSDCALLIHGDSLLVWSPGGYRERLPRRTR